MATIISSNIISPIGMTTDETYQSVKAGKSGLSFYPAKDGKGWNGLPFDIEASLLSDEQWDRVVVDGCSRFESIVLRSVTEALSHVDINKERTIFVLSSTKGDVENLDDLEWCVTPLGVIAEKISKAVGIKNKPVAVCNACISGVSALILAQRLIDSGCYDYAVVCGADVHSRFIVSGFQSFKALSPEPCRPFDIERLGLNLGEAAVTVVMGRTPQLPQNGENSTLWTITTGAVRNDAYHISTPHPKGDGAYLALKSVTEGVDADDLAVIGVHGTATMYNDQMESKAIERAELLGVPLSALKGYLGHTMGAAGILETILTTKALDEGAILPSKGYEMRGVSGKVTLSGDAIRTEKKEFVKMLSGFGGCNGAVRVMCSSHDIAENKGEMKEKLDAVHSVKITSDKVIVDGKSIDVSCTGKAMLTEVYKENIGDYPKFYKMDMLSRLAFIASELLIDSEHSAEDHYENRAVVLFNQSSSIIADMQYEKSICNKDDFFPSPSAFVYTLPNITTGEIAIRHGYHGETSFFILPEKNEQIMMDVMKTTFMDSKIKSIVGGWIDCPSNNNFECEIKIYQ